MWEYNKLLYIQFMWRRCDGNTLSALAGQGHQIVPQD